MTAVVSKWLGTKDFVPDRGWETFLFGPAQMIEFVSWTVRVPLAKEIFNERVTLTRINQSWYDSGKITRVESSVGGGGSVGLGTADGLVKPMLVGALFLNSHPLVVRAYQTDLVVDGKSIESDERWLLLRAGTQVDIALMRQNRVALDELLAIEHGTGQLTVTVQVIGFHVAEDAKMVEEIARSPLIHAP